MEKISSLSSELEESKRMVEDLQSERHQRVSDSEVKRQLQASQETIKELEAEQQRLVGVNFENQQLRDEIANLQNQLQASEIHSESAWQNREAERYAQLQNEIVELKQQAEEGQAAARELEAVQEQLGAVESREMILRDDNTSWSTNRRLATRALHGKKQFKSWMQLANGWREWSASARSCARKTGDLRTTFRDGSKRLWRKRIL
jgi:uncharacterized protein YigA (DUF484 family)